VGLAVSALGLAVGFVELRRQGAKRVCRFAALTLNAAAYLLAISLAGGLIERPLLALLHVSGW
jgi:hypothetical protein